MLEITKKYRGPYFLAHAQSRLRIQIWDCFWGHRFDKARLGDSDWKCSTLEGASRLLAYLPPSRARASLQTLKSTVPPRIVRFFPLHLTPAGKVYRSAFAAHPSKSSSCETTVKALPLLLLLLLPPPEAPFAEAASESPGW